MSRNPLATGLLLCLVWLLPAVSSAQEPSAPATPTLDEILKRLERQEQELKALREKVSRYEEEGKKEDEKQAEDTTGRVTLPDNLPGPDEEPAKPKEKTEEKKKEEEKDDQTDSLIKRLDEIEKSITKSAEEKKKETAAAEEKRKKEWAVKLGGHVQMDFIHWADADDPIPGQDYFEFRRLRLMADGKGYDWLDFRLQIDIEPESGDGVATPVVDVKDAYLSMNDVPVLDRIRIGNFFVPYSLEQVTNDTNNIFVERSIPTQGIFAADREVGVAFYGVNDAQDFTYTSGIFIDSISESLKERIDDNQDYRVSGRLTWLPFYDEESDGRYLLHLGTGILYTEDQDNLLRYRARPQIHEGPFLIDSGNIPAISSTSGNIEMATVLGPLSIQSELFTTAVDRIGDDVAQLYGAYVYASYFLTGEHRNYEPYGQHGAQFGRNSPLDNFSLKAGGGPGAWEMKVRLSWLNLGDLDAGRYRDVTAGFNWYWNDRTRVMFDYIHPLTTEETPFGETASDLTALRMDFNW